MLFLMQFKKALYKVEITIVSILILTIMFSCTILKTNGKYVVKEEKLAYKIEG